MSWGAVSNAVSTLSGYTSGLHGQISSLQRSGNLVPRTGGSHSTNVESTFETLMWSAMGGIPVTGGYVTIGRIIQGKPTNPLFAAGTTVMSGLMLRAIAPKTAGLLAEYYAYQALRFLGFGIEGVHKGRLVDTGLVWRLPTWVYVAVAAGIIYTAYEGAFDTAEKGWGSPPTDMN